MIRSVGLVGLLALGASSTGCSSSNSPPASEPPATETVASPFVCSAEDLPRVERNTTDGRIARRNLDAMVDGRRGLVERRPQDLSARIALVSLLLERTQYAGTFDDFDEAFVHAGEAQRRHPDRGESHLLLARVQTAVHQFDAALELIDEAERRGVSGEDLRLTIWLARGERLDDVVAARRAAVDRAATFGNLAAYAAAQAATGDYAGADASYHAAVGAYVDVSPLPLAWIAFQRGVMWAEMADRADYGCALYREGVSRLPSYVVATTHLSELETAADIDGAISRMRSVQGATTDPEAFGFLGELLLEKDAQSVEATDLIARAKARYDALLEKYPLAFADHGAEFFMGPGDDAERALELAVGNLDNRRNARAYQIAIDAALHAGQADLACRIASESPADHGNVALQSMVDELLPTCSG